VPADINQLARSHIDAAVERFSNGLIPSAGRRRLMSCSPASSEQRCASCATRAARQCVLRDREHVRRGIALVWPCVFSLVPSGATAPAAKSDAHATYFNAVTYSGQISSWFIFCSAALLPRA
jgi:hypothetical protein